MRTELAPAIEVGGERRAAGFAAEAGFGGEPARHSRFLDRDGERLVERRIVLHIDDLVRELVKDESCQVDFPVPDERRQHGVVEVSERRVRGNAGQVHVVAGRSETRRFGARVGLGEIAAIADAARDGKAPLARSERKLRRGEDVPYRVRPSEIGVARVAPVVGEAELAARRTRGSAGREEAFP